MLSIPITSPYFTQVPFSTTSANVGFSWFVKRVDLMELTLRSWSKSAWAVDFSGLQNYCWLVPVCCTQQLPDLNPLGAKLVGVWRVPTCFIPASPSLPLQAFQDWESCLEETGVSKVRLKMKTTGALFEKPFWPAKYYEAITGLRTVSSMWMCTGCSWKGSQASR